MKQHCRVIALLMLVLSGTVFAAPAWPDKGADSDESPAGPQTLKVPFFDGVKLQTSNCNPKLTYANHIIEQVNDLTGSNLDDWNSLLIQSLEVVLWKDLSKYFKADFAFGGSTGSLVGSSTGFKGTPLDLGIRMRQRYSAFELWTNLYFFPLTTNCKDSYSSGRIIEPFIAAGLGYTFFRSEAVFKFRKASMFYDRVRSNWNGEYWGYKMMAGFNINLGNMTPVLDQWLITCSAYQIWNRLRGHTRMHLTDGLRVCGRPVDVAIQPRTRMDIDLTGQYYSIAVGRYF